jgi:hypothetical protein
MGVRLQKSEALVIIIVIVEVSFFACLGGNKMVGL